MNGDRFRIWQVNPTQCGIRDTAKNVNVVFSEDYNRLKKVCDALNELYERNCELKEELLKNTTANNSLNDNTDEEEEIELLFDEDDGVEEERYKVVNNYYKGLVVIDTHISKIERDEFNVNIISENDNIYRLVELLNSQNNELERMKKKINEELFMAKYHISNGNDPRTTYVRTGTFIRILKEILGEK